MDHIAQISFLDCEEKCEGFAAVRAQQNVVGLTLSLATNGDIEVFVSPAVARELAQSLVVAAARAEA